MVRHGSKRGLRVWTFLLCAGLLPSSGWAQEPPTFELPEIIVPGRRPQPITSTPAAVTVLTRQDLERLGVLTVGEALQFVVEVHVRQQGGLGALSLASIRGTSPNQVLVLIDGVPVNSAMLGLFDLSTVSIAQVDRIEVLRGPFSAIYGGEALGGVINIITAGAGVSQMGARIGSFGTTGVAGQLTDATGQVIVSADRFSSGGARANSDVASTTVAGRAVWRSGASGRAMLMLNHFSSDLGVPGATAFPSPQARQREVRTIISGRWEQASGPAQWTLHGYWWRDDFRFTDTAFGVDSQIATQVTGGTLQRVVRHTPGHVQVMGVEWKRQALAHNGPVGARQATVGGIYIQDERQVSPRLLVAAGLRYDLHSLYGGQLNPRLGLVYIVSDGLTFRTGIGRTFRGPSFGELFFTPFNNPNLRPESAWAADASLVWRTGQGVEVRAGVFAMEATDLIRPNAMFIPQNIGRATISGGSLEVAGPLAGGMTGTVNVTALRALDRSTGAQLLRVPWVVGSAALHYRASGGGMLSALLTFVGSRPDIDPATFSRVLMPAYTVVSVRYASAPSASGQWQFGIDNILDAQYEPIAGFPAPGRSFFLGFTKRF